jgi:hypothetical protein
MNKAQAAWAQRKRLDAIATLGGKCARCGFNDWRALQFDHVKGGGAADRRNVGNKPMQVIKDVLANSGKYQILCANCNWIKRYEQNEHGAAWARRRP